MEDTKLFSNDGSIVKLPSLEIKADAQLMQDTLERKILGETVKIIDIPEDEKIAEENFIFDFSYVGVINVMQKKALQALLSKDGDVELYLYNKKNGLMSFGFGEKYKLERVVPMIKNTVFDDEIKIYKNYKIGEQPIEVKSRDITKMRLNL